jgi:uncharacterized repeat protein (TIGR01451 family)
MRFAKPSVIFGAVGALAFSTVAVAGALISGSSGQVIRLSSPPASVAVGAQEDATSAIAFDEQQGTTLASSMLVDAVDPGTYSSFPNGSRRIAAGTKVDSHLVHSDVPAGGPTTRRTGSITFPTDIIGVIGSTARLGASDAALGAPGTTYSGTVKYRGLEQDGTLSPDKFTIGADRRTLSFDVRTISVIDEIRVVTRHVDVLTTTIFDTPDPVTAGNDVQYTLVVTNAGYSPVTDAHVVDTLPAGTTLVSSTSPTGCSGTGPVDCGLGAIAVGGTATAKLVVTSPSTVPAGGTITNSAVASPGTNAVTNETTTVEEPSPDTSKGFVSPGGSIETGGDNPARVQLPNTGPGAPILLTQGPGSFCNGPCSGLATDISSFPGYDDPNHPIHLTLTYTFPDSATSLTEAATAFGAEIYKNDDPSHPDVGVTVPLCDVQGSGIASPHACVDGHTITQPTPNSFVVTFEILYLSGDPRMARR